MALTKVTYGLLSADTSAIDLNIDANTLYVDSSANKVGIQTNSPSLALEVNDTSNVDGEQISIKGSASYGGTVVFRRGDSFNWRVGVGGGSSTNSTIPSSYFGFEQGNTASMVIAHTTGYVGIGTTSPDRQLELEGQGVLRLNATGSNTDPGIDFNTSAANDMQIRYRGASDLLQIYSYGTTSNVVTVKKSNGFVGIGTSSPLDLLHIKSSSTDARLVMDSHTDADAEVKFAENGTVKFTVGNDAATDSFVIGTTNVDTGKRFEINSSGVIKFNGAYTFPTSDGSANQVLQTDGSGALSFATVSGLPLSGGTLTGALQITSAKTQSGGAPIGNLLIADSTSLAANVGGGITFQGVYHSGGSITGLASIEAMKETATHNQYGGALVLKTREDQGSMNEAMRIDSSGNVLIGNTSFNAGSFGGNAHGINVAGVQPMALFHETDTDKDGYIGVASSMMFIQTADAIPIRFGTSDVERMRIDASGNVGIGTSSPNSYSNYKTLTIDSPGSGTGAVIDLEYRTTRSLSMFSESGGSTVREIRNSTLSLGANNSNKMTIHGSGCVGVGSTVDRSIGTNIGTLVVNGSAGGGLWLSTGDASSTTSKIYAANNGSVGELIINNGAGVGSGGIIIKTNENEKMRILSDGSVLVNTTVDSDNQTMRIAQSGSNADPVLALSSDTGDQSYYRYIKFYRKGQSGSVAKLDIDWSGSSIGLAFTSDARLKTVTGEADGLELITRLNPVKYVWKSEPDREGAQGFLAQEVEQAYYETGNSHARGVSRPVDGEEHYMLDDTTLIPNLVKAIKELKDENDALKARVEALES